MRIAICFFGLIRSLKFTHESINENLLKILTQNGIDYDIFIHTYDLKVLNNKRSKEDNVELDVNDYKLLNPKDILIENQDDFDKSFDYEKIMSYGNAWKDSNDNFNSLKNLIRQLNSLNKLTQMIKKKERYDLYIYVRPDTKIVNPFNINLIENIKDNEIRTPVYFKHWGGLNDRFAIGKFNSIVKYGERINYIYDFVNCGKKRPLHSEQLLKFIINKYNIKNIDIDIILVRVRADGREHKYDYEKVIFK